MLFSQAIVLGIVQGLTEFLPVSSSGHLALLQHLFGFQESPITFTILLHFATLGSILVFFHSEIRQLQWKQIKLLIIGSIPIFIIGLLTFQVINQLFASLTLVACGFLVTSLALFSTKWINYNQNAQKFTSKKALLVGMAQAVAIIPGISRSGMTVSTSLHLGIKKETAFTYSFLLSIPAILAALIVQLANVGSTSIMTPQNIAGMLTAFFFGLVALYFLKFITYKSKLYYFGFYCLVLSLVTAYFSFTS